MVSQTQKQAVQHNRMSERQLLVEWYENFGQHNNIGDRKQLCSSVVYKCLPESVFAW